MVTSTKIDVDMDDLERENSEKVVSEDEDTREPNVEEEPATVVQVPDGGWGWLIVLGSFMCNVIVDGVIFSYGLFIPEFAVVFGETKGRLAWIGSIMAGSYLLIGPVVSGFANAYGCRSVTIAGTLISATSLAISSLAPNMEFLCATFGLFCGIGFGFIYLPAVVTVGFYFDKKRAFATGLAVCGSGVGTFIMAPFVRYLLDKYSWKGTLLILAGVVLHCALFGALFRPLQPKPKKNKDKTKPLPPMLQRIKEYRDAEKKTWQSQEYMGNASLPQIDVSASLPEVSNLIVATEKFLDECDNSSPTCSNNSPPPSYSEVVGEEERLTFLAIESTKQIHEANGSAVPKLKEKKKVGAKDTLRPFYRQDILYSASLLNLPEFRSQPDIERYHESVTNIPTLSEDSSNCCCSPVMKDTFRQMLDFSLLKSPTFLVLGVAGFVTMAGFFVPFMFIFDAAIIRGISLEEATYIVPVIGITNTVGRIFSGLVSDCPRLNALTINNVALIIGGLGTIISPFLDTLTLLMAYAAVFGFSIACFATLRSIILVELLGLDKLTNAFGLLLLFQGVAAMLGGPVAGMFYDLTGSYDASFYIAGSFILVSGLLGFPLPAISRWEKRRQRNTSVVPSPSIQIVIGECDPLSERTSENV